MGSWLDQYPVDPEHPANAGIVTKPAPRPAPQTPVQAATDAARLDEIRNPKPTLPAGYRLTPKGTAERVPGLPPEKVEPVVNPKVKAIGDSLKDDHVIRQIGVARRQIDAGYSTNNAWGSGVFQKVPFLGQHAANLHATLDGLQGSVINDTLMQLKSQSATGASGYGNFSEREGDRLAASIGALHQTQDASELKANLSEVEKHYRIAKVLLGVRGNTGDFNRTVYEMIKDGSDLPAVKSLYEATGRPFPPESARRINSAIAKVRGGRQPAGQVQQNGLPPGVIVEPYRQ